ncbi:L-lactate MFS transporter [Alkalibacterium olivapovliticus]|uniref:OFA family oxalate/formate antiporter-like MFS transporter n=1 Tax=Alkalibacterium olivapovliticus TaxID=99907 RepID=A0A2T0W8J1_9LACT|nr:OFA family MFS transporter [Alkalibacterium olivapovliticus]PRY83018.1 OFA family oxalate/formate antiporter-like MFS transporter [Alkalibacterium olivapovliticus]
MEKSSVRWKVLLGGVMMQLCIGGIYTWSLFNQPLVDKFGWERTEVYTAYSLIVFIFAFVTIFSGRLQDKVGPRLVGTIGMICFSTGLIIVSQATTLMTLYLGYSLLGGIGVGMVYVCPLSTGLKWYPRKKGMVTGIIIGAFGLGGFIFNFVLSALIASIGVSQTFLVQGLVYAAVGITGAQLLRVPESDGDHQVLVNERDYSSKKMLKTKSFYLLWIMYFTGSLSGLLIIGLSQDIARDLVGLSPRVAGYAVAVAAIANASGRLGWGALSDVFGRLRVFTLLFGLTAVSMAALSLLTLNVWTYYLLLAVIVSCFGGFLATFPAVCSDYFGSYYFGSNYGLLYQAYGISALVGPLMLSLASRETQAFLWSSLLAVVGLGLTFLVKIPEAE